MPTIRTRPKRTRRGSLLVDVVVGSFLLGMLAITTMSLLPVLKRGEIASRRRSQAMQMVTRMLEQVQMLHATDISTATLSKLNLIDSGQTTQPFSFTHVPMDEASRYSPAQVLRDADAKLSYTALTDGSVKVMVTIKYTSEAGKTQTVNSGTVIGSFR
ncbi:MAG: hypothetical protein JSS65_02105 [Armatimonadetes bacterium]|nr:hypothetical protein [Armatimonadota bacterium]